MKKTNAWLLLIVAVLCLVAPAWSQEPAPPPAPAPSGPPDITKDPTLYVVGYAHLDTQWRWSYPQTIREMIAKTMNLNFPLFEKYPDYVFNFSGANRYRMMREYFPANYEKVKQYVAAGRWFPCGSSMEECDVNVPSAESIIRQVLYGNHYFREELGKASEEFMLPDCFGFPASLPTILGHCGMKGFSTQKLTWGSATGIPFNVGVWEGLDGTGLICALNPGGYGAEVKTDLSISEDWLKRIKENGEKSGVFADYMYYGTGDEGGSPTEDSVKWVEKSVTGTGPVRVISAAADRLFLDIPADKVSKLPRYKGDLMLTEHSAGSITSAAYMKRWNRKNELLADAAERASVLAEWIGGPAYPRERINNAWTLVMGGQFHDILPGTSHPKAYEYSWNDELLALNQFSGVLDSAVSAIAGVLDTRGKGVPVVVYNPLSVERQDVVEAAVTLPGGAPKAVRVFGPDGKEALAQIVSADKGTVKVLFLATLPSVGFAVYDVQPADSPAMASSELKATESSLENARYRVTLDGNGDVSGIFDKTAGRELLSAPAQLAFLPDFPKQWPAWNMDWADKEKPPRAVLGGPAKVRIVENGPARIALEVVREGQDSKFAQTIRLAAGDAGARLEFANTVDWQSHECNLKAVFPLSVSNPKATYNWDVGTIERGNNDAKKYEVASHQWIDLTDPNGEYGVTVLTDCKYASDKPSDNTLRLTLLRTPGTRGEYQDQGWQDWGRHEILYGVAGHQGDWRKGQTDWQAIRMEQPPIAFQAPAHEGKLGRSVALLKINNRRVRALALKKAEDSDEVVVRLVELSGSPAKDVHVALAAPIAGARELNGQEQPIGEAKVAGGELVTDLGAYSLHTFAVKLGAAPAKLPPSQAQAVELPCDHCVTSRDGQKAASGFDSESRCLPAEMLPKEIAYRAASFKLAPIADGQPNAVTCRGQTIPLPAGKANRLYLLLAAANGERKAAFAIDDRPVDLAVQDWGGYIGQADTRTWEGQIKEYAFDWPYPFTGLRPAYIRPALVAWFCSHRHTADGQNEYYAYSYLFAYDVELPAGAKTLTLPKDEHIYVMAATAVADSTAGTRPAQPLSDELKRDMPQVAKITPAEGKFTDFVTVAMERSLYGGGCTTRYTLDGSEPKADSAKYDAPFLLYKDTQIKARLFEGDRPVGTVVEASLKINDTTPPAVKDVEAVSLLPQITVRFSEPLDKASAENVANYRFSGKAKVASAELAPDGRSVMLTLSAPPEDAKFMLTVLGVRDRSPAGNPVPQVSIGATCARPVAQLKEATLDGQGGGVVDQPLEPGAPTAAASPWTINLWLWVNAQPENHTLIAGFGDGKTPSGVQRYLAKFPHGLHFWAANVDVPTKTALEVEKWQMLTATFDGEVVKVYKDGVEVAGQKVSLSDAAPIARIGPTGPWDYAHKLAGKVAGFALWNQALSPASVAALHKLGTQAEPPPKVEPPAKAEQPGKAKPAEDK